MSHDAWLRRNRAEDDEYPALFINPHTGERVEIHNRTPSKHKGLYDVVYHDDDNARNSVATEMTHAESLTNRERAIDAAREAIHELGGKIVEGQLPDGYMVRVQYGPPVKVSQYYNPERAGMSPDNFVRPTKKKSVYVMGRHSDGEVAYTGDVKGAYAGDDQIIISSDQVEAWEALERYVEESKYIGESSTRRIWLHDENELKQAIAVLPDASSERMLMNLYDELPSIGYEAGVPRTHTERSDSFEFDT